MKIRSRNFETIQNIEDEKQKELFQLTVDPSNNAIRLNDGITIDDCIIEDSETANNLQILDKFKEYANEILNDVIKKTKNNNDDDDNNNEFEDMYLEDDYVNENMNYETIYEDEMILEDQIMFEDEVYIT